MLLNGKIILAGMANGSINEDVFLMRYNADDTLDTIFGSARTIITGDMIHGSDGASGLTVQTDCKIVVSATFRPFAGTILTNDFALFSYDAEGVFDTTFFGNGQSMIITDLSSANDDFAYDGQIQLGGTIDVIGMASKGSNIDIGLARYRP